MKYVIMKDNVAEKALIYDEIKKYIGWSILDNNSASLEFKALSRFINYIRKNEVRIEADNIKVIVVDKISTIEISKGALIVDGNVIGSVDGNPKTYTQQFMKNGGLVVLKEENNKKEIIKIYADYNNNIIDRGNNTLIKNEVINDDSNYIIANVRIPKNQFNCGDSQNIKRILDGNFKIYKEIQELEKKIININDNVLLHSGNFENNKNDEYEEKIKALLQERNHLKREIERSELAAYNKIKQDLNNVKVYIDRNIDLDNYVTTKNDVVDMLKKILKHANITNKKIENLLKNDQVINIISEYSDNIDVKIESLQEVKKELIEMNLIEKGL